MLTFEKSAGAIIFRRAEKGLEFLLLKSQDDWGIPKGHIENGETEKEAMIREVFEETGIDDLKITPKFRKSNWYFYRAKGDEKEKRIKAGKIINIFKTVKVYLAETKKSEIKISDEHQDYCWFNEDEIVKKITFDNAKRIMHSAVDFLRKN